VPTKCGNNEGSIKRRLDGRWEARITLDGKQRKSFYGKTRQEVARRLAEAQRDRDKGLPIVGERQTVAQYLTTWLKTAAPTVKDSTWIRYESLIRIHVLPTLGATTLSKVTPQQVQALYVGRLSAGASPTTIIHVHALLHLAFDEALRLSLLQRNVIDLVNPPRRKRHDMHVLAPEQARALLEATATDRMEALYVLALTTGMRQGELFALKWPDVDLENKCVHVRATVQRLRLLQPLSGQPSSQFAFSEPKSARSRRKIALTTVAVEALCRHRFRQLEERLAVGPAWQDTDLVFPNSVGKPIEVGNLTRRNFWPLLDKAGLSHIRFHDLRHTAATLLLLQRVHPKVVSEMLGHASIAITLDLYSHVLPDMQLEATAAMERIFSS
jgi:integrase